MTTETLAIPEEPNPNEHGRTGLGVGIALTAWFLLVVLLGANGAFLGEPGKPPAGLALGVMAPLLVFFAWLRFSRSFRDYILALDPRLLAGMQAWRWMGIGFVFLYACKVLPGAFALPAGLGDMAIGVTAPWMVLALVRRPGFDKTTAFIRWNLLGILDLVVALLIGALGAVLIPATAGHITTIPMVELPLLLVPVFLVPLFMMMHIAALMQGRQATRG